MSLELENVVDIKENDLLKIDTELLTILLKDKTTDKNLIWATDNYLKHGDKYAPEKPISINLITSRNGNIIKPRTEKSKSEQQQRVRQKAEVFTPSWICNAQNNLIDEAWFGKKDVFNTENGITWVVTQNSIDFESVENKTWQDYVSVKRLEVSCGEAPYITSRYDAVSGEYINVKDRIGLLDRKLRVVNENTNTRDEWLKWAYIAVQNIYGFDWQGDNVLIARENVLFTIMEHYQDKFQSQLTTEDLVNFAKVIAWNIWQMDGIKFVIPNSCKTEIKEKDTNFLFEDMYEDEEVIECEGCKKGNHLKHNGIYCKIRDWETHQTYRFVDIVNNS